MEMIKFTLRRKGTKTPLKIREERIKSAKGVNTYYMLNETVGEEWQVDRLELAKAAKKPGTKWYEGTYLKPAHDFEDLEIVKYTKIEIEEIIEDGYSYSGEIQNNMEPKEEIHHEKFVKHDFVKVEHTKVKEAPAKQEEAILKETEEVAEIKEVVQEPVQQIPNIIYEMPKENTMVAEKQQIKETVSETVDEILKEVQEMSQKKEPANDLKENMKMIVRCKKTMYKEMGQVIPITQEKTILFRKGEKYLSYVKSGGIYVVSKNKIPEYIGEVETYGVQEGHLFETFFDIEDKKL